MFGGREKTEKKKQREGRGECVCCVEGGWDLEVFEVKRVLFDLDNGQWDWC